MAIELHGYKYSVYAWIARLALAEKGHIFTWHEINPFAVPVPPDYLELHPFKRVPALVHDNFVLYETGAITRYIDEALAGPSLLPGALHDRARMNQIMSVVDAYAYWPLVRQVFSHGVFRPRTGQPAVQTEFEQGLKAAPGVLAALERLAGGSEYLTGHQMSLADIHLAPMIAYFAEAPEGAQLLDANPRLAGWWAAMSRRPTVIATRPLLPPPRA